MPPHPHRTHPSPPQQASPPAPGPRLVAPAHPSPNRSPLALWHLLSLDAPTVAAVWTLFIAHSAGLPLPWPAPAAMFVAVWMIYAADRLLDARLLDARLLDARLLDARLLDARLLDVARTTHGLEARHLFHHRHRRAFLLVIALAALLLIDLLHHTGPRALHLYALLATLLGVWMLLIHAGLRGAQRLPKEIAVGLFFPAAIFIPTVSRLPALRAQLLPSALLFAAVCALNCLLLFAWEHPPSAHPPHHQAHGTTRWAATHLTALLVTTFTAACIAAVLQRRGPGAPPALACALSVALLWLLHRLRHRIASLHLRALADLVLLTPLLWLVP